MYHQEQHGKIHTYDFLSELISCKSIHDQGGCVNQYCRKIMNGRDFIEGILASGVAHLIG